MAHRSALCLGRASGPPRLNWEREIISKIAESLVPDEFEQEQGTLNTDLLLLKLGTRDQS